MSGKRWLLGAWSITFGSTPSEMWRIQLHSRRIVPQRFGGVDLEQVQRWDDGGDEQLFRE